MATRTRKPKAKQATFPGMEEPTFKDIDAAAEVYIDARDERIALSRLEKERKTALIDKMTEHELSIYKLPDGRKVILDGKTEVHIQKAKAPESNGDGEE
jgi:hypothetical protein